jgi:hypothetical protein
MENKAPLTNTDRLRILDLAFKSGFDTILVVGADCADLTATPEAFWVFVETLLAQRG